MLMATLSLPFHLADAGDIVVAVTLDGQGPFRFLLDTGASRSAVSSEVAARLGLTAVATTVMVTPVGRTFRPLAYLRRVQLGNIPAADVVATVLPSDDLRRTTNMDGIIGQDILASLVYTIDYQHRLIVWHETPPPEVVGTRLSLSVSAGRLLVSLPQGNGTRTQLELVPDSGADGLVLFGRAGRTLPPLTPLDIGVLRTMSGHQMVRRVLLDEFDVGDIRLRDQTAVLVQRTDADAPDGDGLLPLHVFARVTFNAPQRYMTVQR